MAMFILTESIGIPQIAIDGRALYRFHKGMVVQLAELEKQYVDSARKSTPLPYVWNRQRPKPR
jgi:hypothetical protein